MAGDEITTVSTAASTEFRIKGSHFIGHVAPADSVETAETVIGGIRSDHPDATHVVWAYRLATDPVTERSTDAGEPGGSAGEPALSVLRRRGLTDVVAIVVRYYGGTNLGYGGLVRAYARGVSGAIDAATIETRRPMEHLRIEVAYDDSGTVRAILDSESIDYTASYETAVKFDTRIPVDQEEAVIDRIKSATGGRARIER